MSEALRVVLMVDTASPYFRARARDLKPRLQSVVNLWAQRTRTAMIAGIQGGPKTGRTYLRGKNRDISHRASAPGQYPATDTGYLASHIFAQPGSGYADVGTSARYGAFLEFGTSRMAPRPYIEPSLEKARPDAERALREILTP